MATFVIALGLCLAVSGFGGLIASLDLLPTEIGMLYAVCGVIAVSAGFIVLSIGGLIRRVDALDAGSRSMEATERDASPEAELVVVEPEPIVFESAPSTAPDNDVGEEEPLNENRVGHLPTLAEVEHAIAHPESPPTLVGRYSAGGANYMIFSDGTIEAEMEEGAFHFASLAEFKAYLAGRGR
jgi:hypothetical protein